MKHIDPKTHPLSRKLGDVISVNVAFAREAMTAPADDKFRRQLLLRFVAGMAHVQSLAAMLLSGLGATDDDIIKATTIGEDLMNDAIKMAQDRTQARAAVVPARPRTAGPGSRGAPAPLVDLQLLRKPPVG